MPHVYVELLNQLTLIQHLIFTGYTGRFPQLQYSEKIQPLVQVAICHPSIWVARSHSYVSIIHGQNPPPSLCIFTVMIGSGIYNLCPEMLKMDMTCSEPEEVRNWVGGTYAKFCTSISCE